MNPSIRKLVQGLEWYHQRFDGAPMYIFVVGSSEIQREARKPKGTEANRRVCFFSDGKADWYLDMADVRRGAEVIVKLAKKDPKVSKRFLAAWKADENKFQKFFNAFDKLDLAGMTNKALLVLYKKYHTLFQKRFTSSAIIDHFALGTDELIAKMIRQEIGAVGKESDFSKVFSLATAPIHQSFINKAEMELLKIALIGADLVARSAPVRRLQAYAQKYFWIKNNYFTAQVLDAEHFQKELEVWRTSGGDLKVKYEQLKNTAKENKRKKAVLFKQYKFSPLLRTLLKISEDFTLWQDERKKATFLNIHLGTRILYEMASRTGLPRELTKYLVPPEVEKWFTQRQSSGVKGIPSVSELKARSTGLTGMVIWRGRNGVLKYYISTGIEARELRRVMFPVKEQDQVKDIRGLTASVGRVTGRVKVVGSVNEVNKVEKGDILVAVMTRPDYIAGLKKAAAIITNEGGITCHAAIVARELNIPCIIGTKIATEVLHDGDMVEVNANHGVVTVIKKV